MPQRTLDYRRPVRERPALPALPWYKSDLVTAGMTVAVILTANRWLVFNADKSWGFWLWAFFLIPLANVLLAAILLACSPIVRALSGMSASLHIWVTLIGCASAVVGDAAYILARLHGC